MNHYKFSKTIELVWTKATLNLRSEASVNYLSYLWWIVEPLLHMSLYYLVFSIFLNHGVDDYVPFLLSGLIPWLWFSKSISHAMNSIIHGRALMNQLYVPKIFFPLTCLVQDFVKQIIVFFLLLSFLIFYGYEATGVWFFLFIIVVIQLVFTLALGIIAAIVVPFIRDFSIIIPTLLQFLMFSSGIFFDTSNMSEHIKKLFFLNPIAVLIEMYRSVLIKSTVPDVVHILYVAVLASIMLLIGMFLYKKLEYRIPRVVLE
ncbi:ABC transporter permease [Vibrio cholerae]|nr:ABC transporter permease [Vibrio cholerae]EGR2429331.1 ABC transporter permease [Vibrio cholerae]BCN21585.1 putative O-antigen ABC transporter permease [Vibrio cholerae]GHZ73102.1 teichoic acid ABC transporter permease [Vibrio cholerae]